MAHGQTAFKATYDTVAQNTAGTLAFQYSIISDYESLQQALHVDAYLGVSSIGYSVTGSYEMNSSSYYSTNSITLSISAYIDYGTLSIQGLELTDSAALFIQNHEYEEFKQAYGDSYVAQKSLGVSACLFVTMHNLTESQYSDISASVAGQAGTVAYGAAFNSQLQSASSTNSLSVDIKANAGGDWGPLIDAVIDACSSTNPIQNIQNVFSDHINSTYSIANANTTAFTFGPLSQFGLDQTTSLMNIKVQKLKEIYALYQDIHEKNELLGTILASPMYADFHNASDAAEAQNLADQYAYALGALYNAYVACKADPCSDGFNCCEVPQFNLNDQFLHKFNFAPFSSCVYSNPNWSYSYANGVFKLTNTSGGVANTGEDFYMCDPFSRLLARKNVETTAMGAVYNPGTPNGACGLSDGHYWFSLKLVTTTHDGVHNHEVLNAPGYGNTGFYIDNVDSIGDDGILTVQLNHIETTCAYGSTLTLVPGATIKMSVIGQLPNVPAMITPSEVQLCEGETTTLTANSCANCTYLWNTGEASQSITVSAPGNYYVTVTDLISSTTSYWSTVTVVPAPAQQLYITSSNGSILCAGGSNQLTANSNSCIGCTYSWSNQQTGQTIIVNSPGMYTVTASNGCGADISQSITLSLSPLPPEPTFTVNGCVLETPYVAGYGYQWYLNDIIALVGDTTRFCFADTNGFYSVGVTDVNGCTSYSFNTLDTLLYCYVGMSEPSALQEVLIYPNPTNGSFRIRNLPAGNQVYLQIFNPIGDVVLRKRIVGLSECDIEANFAKGLYLLSLNDGERNVWRKLLIE